ncbi:CD1375 family protein [Paenibacillus taichungensis]|nr:CD1375 family protein [Paenibacillus taichungensis]MDR9744114.1 CD1375 family protein [Paenibacillus taichungensis]
MLAVYIVLIHKGLITIDDVPASSRKKVAEALEAVGIERSENIV